MISFEIALNVSFLLIYANIVTLRSLSVRSTQFLYSARIDVHFPL